jgi:hypothetical protein
MKSKDGKVQPEWRLIGRILFWVVTLSLLITFLLGVAVLLWTLLFGSPIDNNGIAI